MKSRLLLLSGLFILFLSPTIYAVPIPGYRIYGQVTFAGHNVSGASVSVTGNVSGFLWNGTTDANGIYNTGAMLSITDGELFTVFANYSRINGTATDIATGVNRRIDVELGGDWERLPGLPGYRIYGLVSSSTNALENATVNVTGSTSGFLWNGTTDANGIYNTGATLNVTIGETITVTALYGSRRASGSGTAAGANLRVDVTFARPSRTHLTKFRIYGIVKDQDNNPLPEASINITGSSSGMLWSGTSDAKGRYDTDYELIVDKTETITVTVVYAGATASGNGTVSGDELEINLSISTPAETTTPTTTSITVTTAPPLLPGYQIYGRVFDNSGNLIPDAMVKVEDSKYRMVWSGTTNAGGVYDTGPSLRIDSGETLTVTAEYRGEISRKTGHAVGSGLQLDLTLGITQSTTAVITSVPSTTVVVTTIPKTEARKLPTSTILFLLLILVLAVIVIQKNRKKSGNKGAKKKRRS